MLGSALKAHVALFVPETLSTDQVTAFFANALRDLSVRAGYKTIKDVSVSAGATTVDVPTDCVDEIFGVRDTDGSTYLDYTYEEDRQYFADAGILRFYQLGKVLYFTASLSAGTVRIEYRSAFSVNADNAEISFPDYLVSLFTMLYVRQYYMYVRSLVGMKKQNAPDIKPSEIDSFIQKINEDIDRECSHLDVD